MKFIVETNKTGFSAYNDENGDVIGTTGPDIPKLIANILEATNLYFEYKGHSLIAIEDIELVYDTSV